MDDEYEGEELREEEEEPEEEEEEPDIEDEAEPEGEEEGDDEPIINKINQGDANHLAIIVVAPEMRVTSDRLTMAEMTRGNWV